MILQLGLCDAWIIGVLTIIILLLFSPCRVLTLGHRLTSFFRGYKLQSPRTYVGVYIVHEVYLVAVVCDRET